MNIEEISKVLADNIDMFDFTKEDLDYLMNLDIKEYDNVNNKYRVTPILNEIYLYSLIEMMIDENCIENKTKTQEEKNKILDLSISCKEFLNELYIRECKNPVVSLYNSVRLCNCLFETVKKNIEEFVEAYEVNKETTQINLCLDRIENVDVMNTDEVIRRYGDIKSGSTAKVRAKRFSVVANGMVQCLFMNFDMGTERGNALIANYNSNNMDEYEAEESELNSVFVISKNIKNLVLSEIISVLYTLEKTRGDEVIATTKTIYVDPELEDDDEFEDDSYDEVGLIIRDYTAKIIELYTEYKHMEAIALKSDIQKKRTLEVCKKM